jgi:hypothetical protein
MPLSSHCLHYKHRVHCRKGLANSIRQLRWFTVSRWLATGWPIKLLILVVVVRIIDWALELTKSMYARLADSWQCARWLEYGYSAVYAIGSCTADIVEDGDEDTPKDTCESACEKAREYAREDGER